MTGRARDMILDPEQTGRLREVIAEGEYYGMQTFDQALLRHFQAGRVVDGGRAAGRHAARTTSSCSSPPRAARPPRWRTSADAAARIGVPGPCTLKRPGADARRLDAAAPAPARASPAARAGAASATRRPRPGSGPAARQPCSLQFVKHCARHGVSMATNDTCPVCRTAEIVCGKWTLLVIRDLADGRSRFCELERSLQGISPRTLSLRLRALEEEGIVERQTYPEVPPRVEYALTDKGRALVPLIEDMRTYGREWLGGDCAERVGLDAHRVFEPAGRRRRLSAAARCESRSPLTS